MTNATPTGQSGVVRLLLVEDDPVWAEYARSALRFEPEIRIFHAPTAEIAAQLLESDDADVVVTDIELPGANGLEILRRVKATRPAVPVVVVTGHATMDHAVGALRRGADDFLVKPVQAQELAEKVLALGREGQRARARMPRVLAIGAHPDDVEIGCAGALLRHRSQGHDVTVLTLTGGECGGDAPERARESADAARILDVRLVLEALPDTRIPEAGATIEAIGRAIEAVRPTIVYTHSPNDNHQDHRAVHRATVVAARRVPELLCYESPSTNVGFAPSRFVDVTEHIELKVEAIRAYHSQWSTRDYLADDLVRSTARYWSRFGTGRYAEPLEIVRAAGGIAEPTRPSPRAVAA